MHNRVIFYTIDPVKSGNGDGDSGQCVVEDRMMVRLCVVESMMVESKVMVTLFIGEYGKGDSA